MNGSTYPRPQPIKPHAQASSLTQDMMLSLVAAGMTLEEVCALYPDQDPAALRKLVQKALKKAPMFLDDLLGGEPQ